MRQRRDKLIAVVVFDSAFLIRNRDDGSHLFLPPPAREKSEAAAIRQLGSYIWVPPPEKPQGLG